MTSTIVSRIPDRLLAIIRSCEGQLSPFPPSAIFCETWMLRLTLDAFRRLGVEHPLAFAAGARWFSEARPPSPFQAVASDGRTKQKIGQARLSEGATQIDAVVGHITIREGTKARLQLLPNASQFIAVEAKMFSPLAAGTTNARDYDQATRTIACMAQTIAHAGMNVHNIELPGFYVMAPEARNRLVSSVALEDIVQTARISISLRNRVAAYQEAGLDTGGTLVAWENDFFLPLLNRLHAEKRIGVLSWEDAIKAVRRVDEVEGHILSQFYDCCCEQNPSRSYRSTPTT